MVVFVDLWNGRLPLARAFWDYAIIYGTGINLVGTAGALAALVLDLPGLVALAIHLLPLAYVAVAVVGVSRSASRYAGPPIWPSLAKAAVLVWAALMVVV